MVDLTFDEISRRIREAVMPKTDLIVGIETGGLIPAALLAYKMRCPLYSIRINYRDEQNRPRHEMPVVGEYENIPVSERAVLLVDDVSVSGQTLQAAVAQFPNAQIKTVVLVGKADFVLFPQIHTCVNWPWKNLIERNSS